MRVFFVIFFLVLGGLTLLAQFWSMALACGFVAVYLLFAARPETEEGHRSVLVDPAVNIALTVTFGLGFLAALFLESERFMGAGVFGALAGLAAMITAFMAWRRGARLS